MLSVVFTCAWVQVGGGHFTNSGKLIKMVLMKGDVADIWSLQSGAILSWNLKGITLAVHKWEGNAGNTWKSRGIH